MKKLLICIFLVTASLPYDTQSMVPQKGNEAPHASILSSLPAMRCGRCGMGVRGHHNCNPPIKK